MVRTPPILPFWPQIPSLTLDLSQKIPKNYVFEHVFEQIFKHFRDFEPLPPLISGLIPNLITPPYVFLMKFG